MEQDTDRILVTGADGQLGRELQKATDGSLHRWIFTDIGQLDITDPEAVNRMIQKITPQVIVNCAAYTNVERAEDEPGTADRINRAAPENLAKAAKIINATLIHISTDYVFGGNGNVPYSENDEVNPLGVYGHTKLAGEQAIQAVGCRSLIFRTAWLYSEFGANFVKTILKLTAEREKIRVVFDQVGSPTYAADLAEFIVRLIENRVYIGKEGIYHYTNEGVCSWYDLAVETAHLAGKHCGQIEPCRSNEFPSKVTRPAFSVLDKTKVKTAFDTKIPYWREALERCINNLQTNKNNHV